MQIRDKTWKKPKKEKKEKTEKRVPRGGFEKIPNARPIREYVDQSMDADFDAKVGEILAQLLVYQRRLQERDPLKAKQRRRLVSGLREVMRSVKTGKAKAVVVSRNIDEGSATGGLDDKVGKLCVLYV